MELRPESCVKVPSHVLHRDLGTETVLLDLDNGIYYGLDDVGTRFWAALSRHPHLRDVHRELAGQFEVPADQLWGDLADFVTHLNDKGLLHVADSESAEG